MKPQLGMEQLFKKFSEFRNLDSSSSDPSTPSDKTSNNKQLPSQPQHPGQFMKTKLSPLQQIISQDQIIAKVRRLKPYLEGESDREEKEKYTFNDKEDDLLCEVLMKQNQRLCSKFVQKPQLNETKTEMRKPGCVFEVVFSFEQIVPQPPTQDNILFHKDRLTNGFIAVTQILQFYESLGDSIPVMVHKMKQLQFVHYYEDEECDYIRIKTTIKEKKGWINIGFISKKRLQIFDQMMFLAFQLTNTNPGRLFNNILLADNFKKY